MHINHARKFKAKIILKIILVKDDVKAILFLLLLLQISSHKNTATLKYKAI